MAGSGKKCHGESASSSPCFLRNLRAFTDVEKNAAGRHVPVMDATRYTEAMYWSCLPTLVSAEVALTSGAQSSTRRTAEHKGRLAVAIVRGRGRHSDV